MELFTSLPLQLFGWSPYSLHLSGIVAFHLFSPWTCFIFSYAYIVFRKRSPIFFRTIESKYLFALATSPEGKDKIAFLSVEMIFWASWDLYFYLYLVYYLFRLLPWNGWKCLEVCVLSDWSVLNSHQKLAVQNRTELLFQWMLWGLLQIRNNQNRFWRW